MPTPDVETPRLAYWNSWIGDREEAVTTLEPENVYEVHFDLAAFDYSQVSDLASFPATVDPVLKGVLFRARRQATISVKPIIGGRGLELVDPEAKGFRLATIDLSRLRNPNELSRNDSLPKISRDVAAAQIPVKVFATEPGCASVALSIWNEGRSRPLDHIVRYVRVGNGGHLPNCDRALSQARTLRGGLSSLLLTPSGREADVTLQIFAMAPGGKTENHAIFVQRGRNEELTWKLDADPWNYISEDTGLPTRLKWARERGDYSKAASELTDVLFGARRRGADQGKKALQIVSDIAASSTPKTFFASMVNVRGERFFLPLGLLWVGKGSLLGESVTPKQPLPWQSYSYSPKTPCIKSWTMILPERISSVANQFLEPISPIRGRTSTWSQAEAYFRDADQGRTEPEGLLLLAHQAGGRISFEPDSDESILANQIRRRFAPGSVAVLSACSVGDLATERSRALLERLNESGVDAIVVSPFALEAPVGARFAFHFAEELKKAHKTRDGTAFEELFRRAVSGAGQDPLLGKQKKEVHEFLLAGNDEISLCR
jgi:hypothetical protein